MTKAARVVALLAVGFLALGFLLEAGNRVVEQRCREAGGTFAMAPIFLASTCTVQR